MKVIPLHDRVLLRRLEEKEVVKGKVPFYTYNTQDEFYRCPGCGKVFWPGSHYKAMLRRLKSLKERLGS